nr:pyridoxal phosphate-dependent aminotransferase [Maliibacterium massiliense]
MQLSQLAQSISASMTLAIDAKAKRMRAEGVDVVGFGAGEPDFPTPQHIIEAAKRAMDEGQTRYTPAAGTLALRQAICEKLQRDNGLAYEPAQIVVSNGAKHALFNACQALLNAGDEAIIPAPYWVTYPELVKMAGAVPVFVDTKPEEDFLLTPQALEAAITDKTRVVILNSPSNPCGSMYSRAQLEALAAVIEKHDLAVISDEIYEKLVYDGAQFFSIASLSPAMQARTVVVNGMSKAYAMTGWRIGYTAAPKDVSAVMSNYQSHCTSNPNSIAQAASLAALQGPAGPMQDMVEAFGVRRDYMISRVADIPNLSCTHPHGAFYLFVDISACFGKASGDMRIANSMDFCAALLEKRQVAAVPGVAFGADNFMRLSYATSIQTIEKGMDRIAAFVCGLSD